MSIAMVRHVYEFEDALASVMDHLIYKIAEGDTAVGVREVDHELCCSEDVVNAHVLCFSRPCSSVCMNSPIDEYKGVGS
jgi:hypothetical protein